jgi:broad specificity phosphatase PhoE
LTLKKIYLIRHGQTDFNLKNIVQGSGVNSSLNDTGRKQAEAFHKAWKHIPFDAVYTSKLVRTQESVQQFIDGGIKHVSLVGLNEISWGKKEGQPITPEEDAYYHHMLKQWQEGKTDLRIEGGESPEEVVVRMKPALDIILNQEKEETILICMHGRAIRILLCHWLHYPLRAMDMFEHRNLCLYQLNYTGKQFQVMRYNDTSHLQLS